jgi:hypothetical protein
MTDSRELTEPFGDEKIDPAVLAVLTREQPSFRRRAAWALIIFCMGVAATLGWQSYGDASKELIAGSYQQLGWSSPQTVGAATPEMTSRIAPVTTSDSQELLKSVLVNLGAVRQSVDQLAAEFVANQQLMANDIAKLKVAEKEMFDKISSAPSGQPAAASARPVTEPVRPATAQARKPVSVPLHLRQERPVR